MNRKISSRAGLAVFTLMAILCAGQETPSSKESLAHTWIVTGLAAQRAGKLAEARIALEKALRAEPRSPEANLRLGLLLKRSGDIAGARSAFESVVQVDPQRPEGHLNLGLTLVGDNAGKRDWPAAMREFRESIRLRAAYGEAHRLLGLGLAQQGDREQAIAEFRLALTDSPDSTEARLELGRGLEEAGHSEEAEREYREIIRLHPEQGDALLELGKILARPTATTEAIDCLRHAVARNPDQAAAQYSLAKALQQTGRLQEAAIAFRAAAASTRHQADAIQCTRLSNEGLDAAHRGDNKAAAQALRKAVDLRPDAPIPHYNLALILADGGDLTGAKSQAVLAISLAPLESRFYLALARICRQAGDPLRARVAIERAISIDPGSRVAPEELRYLGPRHGQMIVTEPYFFGASADTSEEHFAFATVLGQQGDWTGALGEWLRSLALRADSVDARNNLATTYARVGKYEEAELEFQKSLQVFPDSVAAHFGLAVIDLDRGSRGRSKNYKKSCVFNQTIPEPRIFSKSLWLEASKSVCDEP